MAYVPDSPAEFKTIQDMLSFVSKEHEKIAIAIGQCLPTQLTELHAEPAKLIDFMVVAADGTDWDPGSGQGVYTYYNAAWRKLG